MRTVGNYTFFYGQKQCFSNWHMRSFKDTNGVEYNCSEQWMMAMKATLFNDEETLVQIMAEKDPGKQKILGRAVKNFNKELWDFVARELVYQGLLLKFTQNEDHLQELLATKGTTLVEAAKDDTIWGIGMAENQKGVEDPANWRGKNWLGEVLTKLRDDLISEPNYQENIHCFSEETLQKLMEIEMQYMSEQEMLSEEEIENIRKMINSKNN